MVGNQEGIGVLKLECPHEHLVETPSLAATFGKLRTLVFVHRRLDSRWHPKGNKHNRFRRLHQRRQ
jgi:hypothetical protein